MNGTWFLFTEIPLNIAVNGPKMLCVQNLKIDFTQEIE